MTDIAQAAVDVARTLDTTHVGASAVAAIVATEAIEWAKRSSWTGLQWMNQHSETANRVVGGLVAFLTGLGISWSYDPVAGTLVINGLLASSLSHAVVQWAQQQVYFRLLMVRRGGVS